MKATNLQSLISDMSPPIPIKRPVPAKAKGEVLLPVTRLVSTLSMTIQNGQLVARPLVIIASAA